MGPVPRPLAIDWQAGSLLAHVSGQRPFEKQAANRHAEHLESLRCRRRAGAVEQLDSESLSQDLSVLWQGRPCASYTRRRRHILDSVGGFLTLPAFLLMKLSQMGSWHALCTEEPVYTAEKMRPALAFLGASCPYRNQ